MKFKNFKTNSVNPVKLFLTNKKITKKKPCVMFSNLDTKKKKY